VTDIVGDLHDEVECKDKQFNQRRKILGNLEHMIAPCHFQFTHKTSTLGIDSNKFKC